MFSPSRKLTRTLAHVRRGFGRCVTNAVLYCTFIPISDAALNTFSRALLHRDIIIDAILIRQFAKRIVKSCVSQALVSVRYDGVVYVAPRQNSTPVALRHAVPVAIEITFIRSLSNAPIFTTLCKNLMILCIRCDQSLIALATAIGKFSRYRSLCFQLVNSMEEKL